jgi:hypothetical protein
MRVIGKRIMILVLACLMLCGLVACETTYSVEESTKRFEQAAEEAGNILKEYGLEWSDEAIREYADRNFGKDTDELYTSLENPIVLRMCRIGEQGYFYLALYNNNGSERFEIGLTRLDIYDREDIAYDLKEYPYFMEIYEFLSGSVGAERYLEELLGLMRTYAYEKKYNSFLEYRLFGTWSQKQFAVFFGSMTIDGGEKFYDSGVRGRSPLKY